MAPCASHSVQNLCKQLMEGKNFYNSIENRLSSLKQSAESQGVMMQTVQCDFFDRAKNEETQRELELRDAEYAQQVSERSER